MTGFYCFVLIVDPKASYLVIIHVRKILCFSKGWLHNIYGLLTLGSFTSFILCGESRNCKLLSCSFLTLHRNHDLDLCAVIDTVMCLVFAAALQPV